MATRTVHPPIKVGDKISDWEVLEELETRFYGYSVKHRIWSCRCLRCGAEKPVFENSLRRGLSTGCGCVRDKKTAERMRVHGGTRTPEYRAWTKLRRRCLNPLDPDYPAWGGRGITVCDRWVHGEDGKGGFECFLEDMGKKPSTKHSLDRLRNAEGYGPANCEWRTAKQQAQNTRRNVTVVLDGEVLCLAEAARRRGLRPMQVINRRHKGWSDDDLFLPIGTKKPKVA